MDVVLPQLNGIEATRQIVRDCPWVRVIGLSVHASRGYAVKMLQAGARGYVLKDGDVDELLYAVHAVSDGETYLSPEVTRCSVWQ
jgi:DNA-binding NarL/FixJ family response regulator